MSTSEKNRAKTVRAVEIIKCSEGGKEFLKERGARKPYGWTTTVCVYPICEEETLEPGAEETTWKLAKRAARDFLRVSELTTAIVAERRSGKNIAICVWGKL